MDLFVIGRLAGQGGQPFTFPVLTQAGPPPVTAQPPHTYFLDAHAALWEAQEGDTYAQRSVGMGPDLPDDAGEGYVFLSSTDGVVYVRGAEDWVPVEQQGAQGPAGADGVSPKQLSGTGVPGSGLGSAGDVYWRKDTGILDFYGPKTSDGWGDPLSLFPVA